MKIQDAWSDLRKTMELLEELYDKAPGFEQSLAVVKAVQKNMDYLENKHE